MKSTVLTLLCAITFAQGHEIFLQGRTLCTCNPNDRYEICARTNLDGIEIAHERCDKFYKCANSVPVPYCCPANLVFNIEKGVCDWPENVDCGNRTLVAEADNECLNNNNNEDNDSEGDNEDNDTGPCNCNPSEAPQICSTPGSEGVFVAHEYCNHYYVCNHGRPVAMKCAPRLLYNPYKKECDWESAVECGNRTIPEDNGSDNGNGNGNDSGSGENGIPGTCNCDPAEAPAICSAPNSEGTLVAHENCSQFYICNHGRPFPMSCGTNLLYNPYIEQCDFAKNVDCGDRYDPFCSSCNSSSENNESNGDNGASGGGGNSDEDCDSSSGGGSGDNGSGGAGGDGGSGGAGGDGGSGGAGEGGDSGSGGASGDGGSGGAGGDGGSGGAGGGGGDSGSGGAGGDSGSGGAGGGGGDSGSGGAGGDSGSGGAGGGGGDSGSGGAGGDSGSGGAGGDGGSGGAGGGGGDSGSGGAGGDSGSGGAGGGGGDSGSGGAGGDSGSGGAGGDGGSGGAGGGGGDSGSGGAGGDSGSGGAGGDSGSGGAGGGGGDSGSGGAGGDGGDGGSGGGSGDNGSGGAGGDVDEDCDNGDNGGGENECNCDPNEAANICSAPGSDDTLVAHANCNQFYKCANGVPVALTCPGILLYNPHIQECDWPSAVDCGDRVIPEGDKDDSEECEGDDNDNNNESGEGPDSDTGSGQCNCDPSEAPAICAAGESDGVLVAHENCNQFYKCANGVPVALICPPELLYNPYTHQCDYASNVECGDRVIPENNGEGDNNNVPEDSAESSDSNESNNCGHGDPSLAPEICASPESNGVLVAHEHCDKFYMCSNGIPITLTCPPDLLFDPATGICDWEVDCGDRLVPESNDNDNGCLCNYREAPAICSKPGSDGIHVAHENCNQFYVCSHGKTVAHTCAPTLFYNPQNKICDWPAFVNCGERAITKFNSFNKHLIPRHRKQLL